ncbi:MAG: N-acetylmuramoyl-L-alanine amidase [Clostridia bacterium]|nr:N-acetylmuramoyl-L-alanine amidase [Clostridia bacterium]
MKRYIKKNIFVVITLLIFIAITSFYYSFSLLYSSKTNGITIVLDAGHGARDGGSVGVNGTIEKDINLAYTLALKDKLVDCGYKVVLTRKNDEALYAETAKNKKLSDMNTRLETIKKANPNLVVSIHMNSFRSSVVKGANTYYREGDETSKQIADLIQKSLNTYCNAPNKLGKVGDYFILNCTYYTAVLVECGFISNADEEALLNTEEYKKRIVDSICAGITLYFG